MTKQLPLRDLDVSDENPEYAIVGEIPEFTTNLVTIRIKHFHQNTC